MRIGCVYGLSTPVAPLGRLEQWHIMRGSCAKAPQACFRAVLGEHIPAGGACRRRTAVGDHRMYSSSAARQLRAEMPACEFLAARVEKREGKPWSSPGKARFVTTTLWRTTQVG